MSAVEELRHRLEAAYAAIRELDEDLAAGRLSTADHAALRERSEREAAALLQRLRQAEASAAPAAGAAAARRDWSGSAAWLTAGAVGLLGLGVLGGLLIARATVELAPGAPGAARQTSAVGARERAADLAALRREVEAEDTPTAKLLAFAHLALDDGQIPAAIWAYRRVLAREPGNVEAITHMAIILAQGGHIDQALARLDEAIRLDPGYAHAHWDRAQILFHLRKDYAAAARALEGFLALVSAGEDAERARAMLREARARLAGPRSSTPTSSATRPGDGAAASSARSGP